MLKISMLGKFSKMGRTPYEKVIFEMFQKSRAGPVWHQLVQNGTNAALRKGCLEWGSRTASLDAETCPLGQVWKRMDQNGTNALRKYCF